MRALVGHGVPRSRERQARCLILACETRSRRRVVEDGSSGRRGNGQDRRCAAGHQRCTRGAPVADEVENVLPLATSATSRASEPTIGHPAAIDRKRLARHGCLAQAETDRRWAGVARPALASHWVRRTTWNLPCLLIRLHRIGDAASFQFPHPAPSRHVAGRAAYKVRRRRHLRSP